MDKKYLIISNISKRHNVASLFYAAKAYDFTPVMVGAEKLYAELPENIRNDLFWLPTLKDLENMLNTEQVSIVGIEISKDASNVLEFQFPKNIAIMPGNEGTGLSRYQRLISDHLVFIPHYGEGTASLNVHIATTIILQHYFSQEKMVV